MPGWVQIICSWAAVPRAVRFVDDWPMTATGKIQRLRLRELAAAQPD